MKGKAVSGMLLILLFFGMLPMVFLIQPARGEPGTIYIRADGSIEGTTNITSVDNVIYTFTDNNYDEIVVERDNIVVDGAGYTVQGTGTGTGISLWNRNNVTLKNIQASNFDAGIYLGYSSNNTLSNNTASNNNYEGIELYFSSYNNLTGNTASNNNYDGILLYNSSTNVLTGNTASYSTIGDGIRLYFSSYNVLTGNTASNNNMEGIRLYFSSSNVLTGNTASNNNDDGIQLTPSSSNVLTGNTASNNDHGILLYDSSNNNTLAGNTVSNNREVGIYIDSSSSNVFTGNTASNNARGIWLTYSSNSNYLTGNTASNNDYGIILDDSSSNVLTYNTASNNLGYGIWLGNSGNNTIFHNNFVNNPFQAHVTAGYVNTWNDGYPSGGNYWSDYSGVDVKSGPNQDQPSSDGIGDTALVIDASDIDHYPLMYPWGSTPPPSYNLTIFGSLTEVPFTVDDVSRTTPWSGSYSEGSFVALEMPQIYYSYNWSHWLEDGDPNRMRTVVMDTNITLTAVYEHPPAVGGIYLPADKLSLLAPYIGLIILLALIAVTVVYVKKRKKA